MRPKTGAPRCSNVAPRWSSYPLNSDVTTTSVHRISIQSCDFKGARRVQVHVGPPQVFGPQPSTYELNLPGIRRFVPLPVERVSPGAGDIPGFDFSNCLIECPDLAPSELSRGMHFRTANGVGLRVVDTSFRGPSACYVDIASGMVLLEGCEFDNPAVETARQWRELRAVDRGFEGPGGEDVYLSAHGVPEGQRDPIQTSGYVAMVSCRSRSATLFGTPDPSPQGINNGRPNRSNLILGCRHEPTPGRTLDSPATPTSVRWGRLASGPPRVGFVGGTNYGAGGTLSVVGCFLGGAMCVVAGAAQSVLFATRTSTVGNRPLLVDPSRQAIYEDRIPQAMNTVVFGLQCLALLLTLLLCAGCHSSRTNSPQDAVVDPDVPTSVDLGSIPADDGSFGMDHHRFEVELVDRLDAGSHFDAVAMDRSERPMPEDVPLILDLVLREDRYIDPIWAMQDVISRDIEVLRAPDAPLVWSFGPPRQMRANCPAVTDGEEGIAAPRLLFPMSPMRATSQRPTLFWRLPTAVDGARIELCRDRCCTQRITTLDVTGSSVRPPTALPPGVVFWRARGRVGTRFGRETSFTWEFGVKHRDAPTDTAWGAIKDFNGDGYDDLFDNTDGDFLAASRIYWGGADGIEAARFQQFESPVGSTWVSTGDFNGDGLSDYAAVSSQPPPGEPDAGTTTVCPISIAYGDTLGVRLGSVRIAAGFGIGSVDDFNGDGFSDFATRGPVERSDEGTPRYSTLILYGGPEGLGSGGEQRFPDPLGDHLRPDYGDHGSCGDLNADGYAELLVGDNSYESYRGAVYVFEGGAQAVRTPASTVLRPDPEGHPRSGPVRFGFRHNIVGDVNGDRVGDLLMAPYNLVARDLYLGGGGQFVVLAQQFAPPVPNHGWGLSAFGGQLYVAPDLNGDGLADPVLPCSYCGPLDPSDSDYGRGYVYVYSRGRTSPVNPLPVLTLRGGAETWDRYWTFGLSMSVGDYDGDGYDDLAVGDPESRDLTRARPRGKIYLIFGGSDFTQLRRALVHGESATVGQSSGVGGRLAVRSLIVSRVRGS